MNEYKQVIEIFKMENELMEFDPSTGEKKPIELQNEDNQDLYKANLVAISALEKLSDKNCSRCVDKNRCAIHDRFNIDYCSYWRVWKND